MEEKKYGKCPKCNAPCEVTELIDVQGFDGVTDTTDVPYDQYKYHPQHGPVWPLCIVDKVTGERHEVNKIVYHPENEPEPHVWCDTWYGHHVIGKDCEWAGQESPAAGRESIEFAHWLSKNYQVYAEGIWQPNEETIDNPVYTETQLYELFKQKEK